MENVVIFFFLVVLVLCFSVRSRRTQGGGGGGGATHKRRKGKKSKNNVPARRGGGRPLFREGENFDLCEEGDSYKVVEKTPKQKKPGNSAGVCSLIVSAISGIVSLVASGISGMGFDLYKPTPDSGISGIGLDLYKPMPDFVQEDLIQEQEALATQTFVQEDLIQEQEALATQTESEDQSEPLPKNAEEAEQHRLFDVWALPLQTTTAFYWNEEVWVESVKDSFFHTPEYAKEIEVRREKESKMQLAIKPREIKRAKLTQNLQGL